jgi:hypothetical protein
MPNWCSNYLEIEGPVEELDAFISVACADPDKGLLTTFYPPRPDVDQYDWCVANWSTKWDIGNPITPLSARERPEPTRLGMSFDSAWAPPEHAIQVISALCPKLRFRLCYEEGGCNFAGFAEYKAGGVISEDSGEAMPTQIPAKDGDSEDEEYVDNPDYVGIDERWEDMYCDSPLDVTAEELADAEAYLAEECAGATAARLCEHCHVFEMQHVKKQCLFGPTKYKPGGPMVRIIQWPSKQSKKKNRAEKAWASTKQRIEESIHGATLGQDKPQTEGTEP